MANTLLLKRSAVPAKVPLATDLNLGELAVNTYDGKLFLKKNIAGTESIVEIGAAAAANTLTGTTLAAGVVASSLTSFGASPVLGTPLSGNLANCTFPTLNQSTTGNAATAGTVTTAAQPSITSVGTLSGLTVTAPITGSVTGSSGSTTGNAATATSSTQATKLSNGGYLSDVNTAPILTTPDLYFQRYDVTAINKPVTANNANGLLTLVTNPSGGAGSYGRQFAIPDTEDIYTRQFQNGALNPWRILLHSGNFTSYAPALTGTGASGTWGISISGNAGTVGGYAPSTSTNANTLVQRDSNGYSFFFYINSSTGNSENPAISQVIVTNGGDGYYRKASIAHLTSNLSGTAPISITGNAATASSASSVLFNNVINGPVAADWPALGATSVAGLLGWKNYGNSHVIFDASNSTSPSGTAISNSVPQIAWIGTYPTLMGWNGSYTHGVKVNRADLADTTPRLTGPAYTNGTDGWFRSQNQAGWYNETYAVGIYSTAAGVIRTYNNASFVSEGGITATTGLNVAGNGGFFNAANKFGVDNNAGQTRFYSSGANSATRGSYDFRITDSTGALDTSVLSIAAAGNVGIGTTTPTKRLHVGSSTPSVGAADVVIEGVAGGYGAGISLQSRLGTSNALAEMGRMVWDGESAWSSTSAATQNSYARLMVAKTGVVTEALRVDSSGNFLLGATARDFEGQLYVKAASGTAAVDIFAASGAEAKIQLLNNNNSSAIGCGTGGSLLFYANTRSTERMRLDSVGNLGLGTSVVTLGTGYTNVHARGSTGAILEASNATHSAALSMDSTGANVGSRTSIPLRLTVNNSPVITLAAAGNVTIAAPSSGIALTVNGSQTTAGSLLRSAHNNGMLVGGYNNIGASEGQTSPIYCIGTSYVPAATTLGSMYGIGYSTGFGPSGSTGWGAYFAQQGVAQSFVGSGIWTIGDVTAYASDARMKTNVTTITNALAKVEQIRGVEYDWVDGVEDLGFTPSAKHETGVIAQEIQTVIPDAVMVAPFNNEATKRTGIEQNYLTVNKEKIIPLLIEAVKELSAQNKALIARLEALEVK